MKKENRYKRNIANGLKPLQSIKYKIVVNTAHRLICSEFLLFSPFYFIQTLYGKKHFEQTLI